MKIVNKCKGHDPAVRKTRNPDIYWGPKCPDYRRSSIYHCWGTQTTTKH